MKMELTRILREANKNLKLCEKSLGWHIQDEADIKYGVYDLEGRNKSFMLKWIQRVIKTDKQQISNFKSLIEKWSK